MLARLRENLIYKLLALGFAIALHFYVVAQENPSLSRTILVPLTVRGLPPNLLFDEKAAPQISVTLNGPADILNHLPDADVVATVDLSQAHAGKNTPKSVHIILPPGESGLGADAQPAVVSVGLANKVKRMVPISASDPGTPPAGYLFHAARITPHYATLEGSQEAVASVHQIVANVDSGGAVGTIESDFPLVALDAQGAQVSDVAVTPTSAHVFIKMDRVPSSRTLFVNADLTGAPPYPYKVTGVDVSPQTVTVAGRPEFLSQVSTVQTAPISVTGATTDVTRRVDCIPPSGLTISEPQQVTVTVHIAAQPAPVAPAPPVATVVTPNEPKPQ